MNQIFKTPFPLGTGVNSMYIPRNFIEMIVETTLIQPVCAQWDGTILNTLVYGSLPWIGL